LRITNIAYILSRLSLILGGSFVVPLLFSVYYKDGMAFIFLGHAAVLGVLSLASYIFKLQPQELSSREGFLVVFLCWLFFAVFGCLPFLFSGYIPAFVDAFFETVSGFTTTGASILNNIEVLPKSLLLWRNMTQWLGGMGVIALAVAVFPFLGVGASWLFRAEVPGPTKDKISPRISSTAKLLWWVYVIFTVAEMLLLMLGGMPFFDAICVTFGTMATGGFAPKNDSIAAYSSIYTEYVIIFFMFLAGMNFNLHYWAMKGRFKDYFRNTEWRLFTGIILGAAILIIAIRMLFGQAVSEKLLRESLFQVVSIITTTGFVTDNYELWPFSTQIILLLLMVVGGCASSTGGGVKNARILIIFKHIGAEMKKILRPRGVFPVKVENKTVPDQIVSNVMAFMALYIFIFIFGVLSMSLLGLDFESAVGAVITTLGNVGPGIGSVGPKENFAHMPDIAKYILSFLMLAGRLEIYTVIIVFSPKFWK
jgi:trk system potassium uptake protein TrkH